MTVTDESSTGSTPQTLREHPVMMAVVKVLVETLQENILNILDARGIPIGDGARSRIMDCEDVVRLKDWVVRSATVKSACEIFYVLPDLTSWHRGEPTSKLGLLWMKLIVNAMANAEEDKVVDRDREELLRILDERGIDVPPDQLFFINMTNVATAMRRWLGKAHTIERIDELFVKDEAVE
ncbi:hypothetical protein D5S18_00540 [Nocardia panacis]|uniref:Uncharacterized protein n=1 Tax=Nocardia panacis TaxID=2340916 RepID=A0A3A4L083_9NOCA|nr:hypothetical protein [Nocardia panacis]RJO79805.1 hypothetical protein D5S18_00540 [Nocardia panacis]